MTYCCGILVNEGLVMIADTRTNAGLDNVSTFRKLNVFEKPGRHVMMIASAGNLSVTQSVLNLINEGFANPETGLVERLEEMASLFDAALLIGRAVRKVRQLHDTTFQQASIAFEVSFLFGGQIAGRRLRLFMIYAAGNFIECTQDAPFLQIGEHKYGKPILDRAIDYDMDIDDALKIGLISMDSTIKSNLGVGLPIDVAVVRRDRQKLAVAARIGSNDAYFNNLRESWSQALRDAHIAIPRPPYGRPA